MRTSSQTNLNYSTAIAQTWRHRDVSEARRDFTVLVHYATLAASSHNTQPWKFGLDSGAVRILPDFSRRCPAVDPDDHHLYASLGCAAENLLLAAQAAGLRGNLSFVSRDSSLRLDLEHATPMRSILFEAIPSRQCSRSEYDGGEIPGDQLRFLEQAATGDGISAICLNSRQQKDEVAQFVAAGNRTQFRDSQWERELQSWIRFNAGDAIEAGDGLYGPVMGSPDVPRWLGKLFMRLAFSAARQNRKDIRHIQSSGAVVVLVSDVDDKPHWVEAGRCCERLALQAAALDLRAAFINQPVEVAALRPQFASYLGVGRRRPDLIVRVGRGPSMPRSLRRPVAQVLV